MFNKMGLGFHNLLIIAYMIQILKEFVVHNPSSFSKVKGNKKWIVKGTSP